MEEITCSEKRVFNISDDTSNATSQIDALSWMIFRLAQQLTEITALSGRETK